MIWAKENLKPQYSMLQFISSGRGGGVFYTDRTKIEKFCYLARRIEDMQKAKLFH